MTTDGIDDMPLSRVICWTRMQAEAGQLIEAIFARKELERKAGDGLFCWGIGNAPPRTLAGLVRHGAAIDVVFSLMKSRPKKTDAAPSSIVVWRSYFDFDGVERSLPVNALVTSSAKSNGRAHYALMCHADEPLVVADMGAFDPRAYRNVSEAARPVGASQVTALLQRVTREEESTGYRVNFRASLAKSFWVKLGNPIELSSHKRAELFETLGLICDLTVSDWMRLALGIRSERRPRTRKTGEQLALFGR